MKRLVLNANSEDIFISMNIIKIWSKIFKVLRNVQVKMRGMLSTIFLDLGHCLKYVISLQFVF